MCIYVYVCVCECVYVSVCLSVSVCIGMCKRLCWNVFYFVLLLCEGLQVLPLILLLYRLALFTALHFAAPNCLHVQLNYDNNIAKRHLNLNVITGNVAFKLNIFSDTKRSNKLH